MEQPVDQENGEVAAQQLATTERKTIFIDLKGRKRKKKANNNNNNNNGSDNEREIAFSKEKVQAYEKQIKELIAENIELKHMMQSMQDEEDVDDYMDVTQNNEEIAAQRPEQALVTDNTVLKAKKTTPDVIKQVSTKKIINGGPPAFILYNINHKLIKNKLFETIKNDNFTLQVVNQNVTKLRVSTSSDHTMVKNLLKNEKVNFFTYTPKDLKPYTLFINGIPNCFEESEVNEAIIELNTSAKIIKIQKLKNSFLLQVDRETDIESLKTIRYLLHCKVTITDAKKKRFLQCKNCQRYSHSASNCNMPYRCVKCGESHGPGKCKIPPKEENNQEFLVKNASTGEIIKTIGIPVKCINCNVEGHTANAPVCPKRIELMSRFAQKKKEMRTKDAIKPSFFKHNVSFASVAAQKPVQFAHNVENFNTLNKDFQEIFGKDFFSCLAKVGQFNEVYKTL